MSTALPVRVRVRTHNFEHERMMIVDGLCYIASGRHSASQTDSNQDIDSAVLIMEEPNPNLASGSNRARPAALRGGSAGLCEWARGGARSIICVTCSSTGKAIPPPSEADAPLLPVLVT